MRKTIDPARQLELQAAALLLFSVIIGWLIL